MPPSPYIIVIPEIVAFGGAERSAVALSGWLQRHAMPHRLVTYYDTIGLEKYAGHPVEMVRLEPKRTPFHKIAALRNFFRAASGGPKPLMSGIQAALHASAAGLRGFHTLMHDTPSLLSDGGTAPGLRGWLRRKATDAIIGWGLRSGGCTIVTSEYLKRECEQLYGGHVEIARMGGLFSTAAFRPRTVDAELRMLSVSRVEANKRIDWVLRALAALEREGFFRGRTWRLDVVGTGTQAGALADMSRALGIAEHVAFHGFVGDRQLAELYERTHLFLMPAVQGYGIPTIEALYRGIPVLLHRDSGVSDILMETPWCVVARGVEENFKAALAESIERLLAKRHVNAPLPAIPSEDDWAARVALLCGWTAPPARS
ncbi:MAG TPA: glycosyltransferase family 4 protein [Candidatus Binataceae bacterium]|nr:glycosyltransferase family 4 protein [Candidatus Binataceae bacterium]